MYRFYSIRLSSTNQHGTNPLSLHQREIHLTHDFPFLYFSSSETGRSIELFPNQNPFELQWNNQKLFVSDPRLALVSDLTVEYLDGDNVVAKRDADGITVFGPPNLDSVFETLGDSYQCHITIGSNQKGKLSQPKFFDNGIKDTTELNGLVGQFMEEAEFYSINKQNFIINLVVTNSSGIKVASHVLNFSTSEITGQSVFHTDDMFAVQYSPISAQIGQQRSRKQNAAAAVQAYGFIESLLPAVNDNFEQLNRVLHTLTDTANSDAKMTKSISLQEIEETQLVSYLRNTEHLSLKLLEALDLVVGAGIDVGVARQRVTRAWDWAYNCRRHILAVKTRANVAANRDFIDQVLSMDETKEGFEPHFSEVLHPGSLFINIWEDQLRALGFSMPDLDALQALGQLVHVLESEPTDKKPFSKILPLFKILNRASVSTEGAFAGDGQINQRYIPNCLDTIANRQSRTIDTSPLGNRQPKNEHFIPVDQPGIGLNVNEGISHGNRVIYL